MRRYVLVLAGLLLGGPVVAQERAASIEQLLQGVQAGALTRSVENEAREQRFVAARDQQEDFLRETERDLAAERERTDQLNAQFDQNEIELTALSERLRIRMGNMGELFGVVRQVAGDTQGIVDTSLVSAQLKGRSAIAGELAEAVISVSFVLLG